MKNKELLLVQYENWASVLKEIKQNELKWISILLLIYGAILAFQVNLIKDSSHFDNKLLIISIIFLLNLIISLFWGYQSLNFRIQYYRSMIKLTKIQFRFKQDVEDYWFKKNFKEWRKNETRPFETKIVDFSLLSGLMLISNILALYYFDGFDLKSNCCQKCLVCLLSFYPIGYFIILDCKKLKKLYNANLPLIKEPS